MLAEDKSIANPTLQGRLQSFLDKGPSLPAKGLIFLIRHLRRTTCPGSGKETCYLLYPTAKDQKGSPRILENVRILLHLDIQIFKLGQTILQGHSRLWKGLFKLVSRSRKGFPGDKETVNQCLCSRAARCNTTIDSLHL
jgi:hypothetical protein